MINLYLKEETALVKTATIYGINGPVIYLKGNTGFCMSEMVYVGKQKLVGEVIALDKDLTTVQVSRRGGHCHRQSGICDPCSRYPE